MALTGALLVAVSPAAGLQGEEVTHPGAFVVGPAVDALMSEPNLHEAALARLDERLAKYPEDNEASFLKGLLLLRIGRTGEALTELDELTRRAPESKMAHLIHGTLQGTQGQSVRVSVATVIERTLGEADGRLHLFLDGLPRNRVPSAIMEMGERTAHAVLVDKSNHRLYLYERADPGEPPLLLRDFHVSTGKLPGNKSARGDLRTPEGVYLITDVIPKNRLPRKYGNGAFPINYPNEFDLRLGKTGDGIWLHGTEEVSYDRPPLDSEGCVVLSNEDLEVVSAYIRPGVTPVVITDRVKWMQPEEWKIYRSDLLAALDGWRRDWESRDVEKYLGHYARDFWSEGYDLRSWSVRKRRVAKGKRYQKVMLSHVSAFVYPLDTSDGRELAVFNFRQDYRSNNFKVINQKRLYLAKENERWKVVYEGRQ